MDELFPNQLTEFVENRGPLKTEHDLLHFLLKYRYTDNWQHEVREDYLGMTYEELVHRVLRLLHRKTNTPYTVKRMHHFQLNWLADRINRDTGIQIPHRTHIECVLSANV